MIEINNLTIVNHHKTIIKNLNLHVSQGESVSILGPSGIGKSTLSFAILGDISEGLYLQSGSIKVGGSM